jgi:predicted Zn-dependent protease
MAKLIDLSHRKEATDLLVDSALLAVWYGYPESSRLLVEWMKLRSDKAAPVMYIDALRALRFDQFDESETILRELLGRFPDDLHAQGLLLHVLFANGDVASTDHLAATFDDESLDPTVRGLVQNIRARLQRAPAQRSTLAHGVVMG